MLEPLGSHEGMSFCQHLLLAIISPTAILVAAYIAWKAQRRIATCRATLDFISKYELDNAEWSSAKGRFSKIVAEPDHPKSLIALLTSEESDDTRESRIAVVSLLNHFEAVAVAIEHGVISEAIYKDWNKSGYVGAWHKAQSFVTEDRKRADGKPTTWENFQKFAEKWEREPAEQKSRRWFGRAE